MSKLLWEDFQPTFSGLDLTRGETRKKIGDISDLAQAFLSIDSMTHKKLQKMCYYAKAWYLAINDINLVNEQFEAWVHGAVQPKLYQEYKVYGFACIPQIMDARCIPEEFLSFARDIYESYGDLDGDELESLNHTELPWINARKGLKPWQGSNNIILEDDMKTYYRTLMENEG